MGNPLEEHLLRISRSKKIPLKATLELTPLCNMNCRMCYINEQKSKLDQPVKSVEYWLSLVSELQRMGTLFVTLIGGEPFLYPGIDRLYKTLMENGFYISITTNGTLLADGLPEWLTETKPKYVTVSLYGASNETYERVTGNPDGYTQAMAGIRHLEEANIPVLINCCVIPENIQDIEAILRFGKENNHIVHASHYSYPNNSRRKGQNMERLSPEQAAAAFWKIYEILRPEEYSLMLEREARGEYECINDPPSREICCNAGRSQMWISWKGTASGCGIFAEQTIPVPQGELESSWRKVTEVFDRIQTAEECAVCRKQKACSVCAAMMFTETGSFGKAPSYRCRIMEEREKLAKRLIQNRS